MSEISFTVWGEPVAQGRPRAFVRNGHAAMYDPAKSRDYKSQVRDEAVARRPPGPLIAEPVSLTVKVFQKIPKSFSKAKRAAALAGVLRPTTKPDLKNVLAGIEDALNQVVWEDDSQVIDFGESSKWYSDRPRVEVTIRTVGV